MTVEKKYVIGVDIGGQTSKLGIVDTRGNVLARSRIRTDNHDDPKLYVKELGDAIRELAEKVGGLENIRGVGIGAPNGNYYKGSIEFAPNLRWKGIVPMVELVKAEVGLPVAITNDANAAAVGEMTYGVARGMKNFIMITLGTGVGSGIVIDGKVVYGHDGFAGELGHTIQVRHNGRQCGCGRSGCLEAYASAVGVARSAREILESTNASTMLRNLSWGEIEAWEKKQIEPWEKVETGETIPWNKIESKHVAYAAEKGDEVALGVLKFTGEILGRAMADFVAFSAPEAIVLFGGLTKSGDLIKEPVEEALNDNVLNLWKDKVKVLFSELAGDDAAILGASALGWEL